MKDAGVTASDRSVRRVGDQAADAQKHAVPTGFPATGFVLVTVPGAGGDGVRRCRNRTTVPAIAAVSPRSSTPPEPANTIVSPDENRSLHDQRAAGADGPRYPSPVRLPASRMPGSSASWPSLVRPPASKRIASASTPRSACGNGDGVEFLKEASVAGQRARAAGQNEGVGGVAVGFDSARYRCAGV